MKTILIAATSLDGFIAEKADQVSTAWTSEADKKFFGRRSKEIGVMVMGRATYETIGRPLPGRISIVLTRNKGLIAESGLEELAAAPKGIKPGASLKLSEKIRSEGWDQVPYYTDKSPAELLKFLQEKGWQEVAICGGARVYADFMVAELVNQLELSVESVMLGRGVKLLGEGSAATRRSFELLSCEKLAEKGPVLLTLIPQSSVEESRKEER